MSAFRFRWTLRQGGGREAFDAYLGRFHVGQIDTVSEHGSGRSYWAWHIPVALPSEPWRKGEGSTPREAALRLEETFPRVARSARAFSMRIEEEVIFRAVLALPHTPQLEYRLAVANGEHVRPISLTDKAGWDRWLAEERRRGTRSWISPEDLREWFGGAYQEPRTTVS